MVKRVSTPRAALQPARKPAPRVPGRIIDGGSAKSIVDRAITKVGGRPITLARVLSGLTGREIKRQDVNGWRGRRKFPRSVIVHVHKVTGISLVDLISASE